MENKLLLLSSVSILLASCQQENKQEKPNVIYICIEDMTTHLGCYGDTIVHSPNIDAFAHDAIVFEDAHCQVALCTPSRNAILTGIRPSTSGMVKIDDHWQEMLPEAVSLQRHFKDHGYYTIQAGKIHDYRCGGMDSAYNVSLDIHGLHNNELPFKALNMATTQDQPFFLAVGYAKVHDIWHPSEGAKKLYNAEDFSSEGRSHHFKGREITDEQIQQYLRDYYADITDVDSLIGNLLDSIKAKNMYDNSIIMVGVFDHGYTLGRHGKWGKGDNTDMETHVPLIVRTPGNENNGKRAPGIVELVDIYPTLIDLCELPDPPQDLEGLSFTPLLEDPELDWKTAAFTHRAYHINDRGLKTKDYTLIKYENEAPRLYDRKKDPENLTDIAAGNPEKVEELMEILKLEARSWKLEGGS